MNESGVCVCSECVGMCKVVIKCVCEGGVCECQDVNESDLWGCTEKRKVCFI